MLDLNLVSTLPVQREQNPSQEDCPSLTTEKRYSSCCQKVVSRQSEPGKQERPSSLLIFEESPSTFHFMQQDASTYQIDRRHTIFGIHSELVRDKLRN